MGFFFFYHAVCILSDVSFGGAVQNSNENTEQLYPGAQFGGVKNFKTGF